MPERKWQERIRDMIASIDAIISYSGNVNRQLLANDAEKVDAILFRFSVIGEAVAHIPETVRGEYPEIPWQSIRDMRNFIVHIYWGVDLDVVWDTIRDDLPPLIEQLHTMLEKEERL